MQAFDSARYGPEVAALLEGPAPDGLCHGAPVAALEAALAALQLPPLCQAALWLRFDFGERGHGIVQGLAGADASYWHAIHHRREPDADNAKYWFRRVGAHPIHDDLLHSAAALRGDGPAVRRVAAWTVWDASGFVDLCAAYAGKGSADEACCKAMQQREWSLLFDRCFHAPPG